MHRVRNVPNEFRTKRLLTPTVADNRISFGCVNVPANFYDRYVDLMFSSSAGRGVRAAGDQADRQRIPVCDGTAPARVAQHRAD